MSILFYEDTYYLFSNWSAHQIEYKGVLYATAEHAYHSQRFTDESIIHQIASAKSPLLAKEFAYKNKDKQIDEWDEIKINVMTKILQAKAAQHEEVKNALLQTGTDEIIENSPDDYFWGCGKDKSGRNELGKIWMKIREEVKK